MIQLPAQGGTNSRQNKGAHLQSVKPFNNHVTVKKNKKYAAIFLSLWHQSCSMTWKQLKQTRSHTLLAIWSHRLCLCLVRGLTSLKVSFLICQTFYIHGEDVIKNFRPRVTAGCPPHWLTEPCLQSADTLSHTLDLRLCIKYQESKAERTMVPHPVACRTRKLKPMRNCCDRSIIVLSECKEDTGILERVNEVNRKDIKYPSLWEQGRGSGHEAQLMRH